MKLKFIASLAIAATLLAPAGAFAAEQTAPDALASTPAVITQNEVSSDIELQSVSGTLSIPGQELYSEAFDVVDIVNQERASQGLSPVTMDQDLMEAAMQRAAETVVSFSHTRPNGQICFTVSGKAYGENIAVGAVDAADAMNLWMNSPGHRSNILTGSWNSIGVGAFRAADGSVYWVQLFGPGRAQTATEPADATVSTPVDIDTSHVNPQLTLSLEGSEGAATLTQGSTATPLLYGSNPEWYSYIVSNDGLTWSSSDTSVLSVTSNGTVTARSAGTATLTARNGSISASITVTVQAKVYTDVVPGTWYTQAVDFATSHGLLTGYSGTNLFGVGNSMTRAELAVVLWRVADPDAAAAYNGSAANQTGMADVNANDWYTGAANWAVSAGVINGSAQADGSRIFDPNGKVSREQFASIIANFVKADLDSVDTSTYLTLPDCGSTTDWAVSNLAWAVDNGIINGKDENGTRYLRPLANVTREEAAAILMNCYNKGILE